MAQMFPDWQHHREPKPASHAMNTLITTTTSKSITEAATALRIAVEDNDFGVMQVHNLKESMWHKGIELGRDCLIFEICQPEQAKRVLDLDMSVSTALPCRISLYREEGKTVLAAIRPTTILLMFGTPQLKQVAEEVEDTMVKIMNEAAAA